MTFTAKVIGQTLPFPFIPIEEVILSYAKAMAIPQDCVATLVGCRTSVKSKIANLGSKPRPHFIMPLPNALEAYMFSLHLKGYLFKVIHSGIMKTYMP